MIVNLRNTYSLLVTLKGFRPPIWRKLLIPDSFTLTQLHAAIQIMMQWGDRSSHVFIQSSGQVGDAHPTSSAYIRAEAEVRLSKLLQKPQDALIYEYDTEDEWVVQIDLEQVQTFHPAVEFPQCLTGERASPPENCGGVWGFEHLLKAWRDSKHPDHLAVIKKTGANFHPEKWDIELINQRLSALHC